MRPKSFSATAMEVAEDCTARYLAEMVHRSKGASNVAASLGSSVHGALELYVKATQLEKSAERSLPFLLELFKMSYMTTFSTSDIATPEFFEGVDMLTKWHERSEAYWKGDDYVVSVEKKDNFPIKTSIGEIPFNYIWDRFDYMGNDEWKVVDYKTNRWGIRPDDLRKKVQPRAYSVAAAIQLHKQGITPKRIWVEFDMLRHDGPVGISFSRDENVAALTFFRNLAQRIIDTPEDEVQETLNNKCLFCVRKQSCGALKKNIATGGLHSITTIEEAIDHRAQLEMQGKAINAAIKELDSKIIDEAKARDATRFESDTFELNIGMSGQRAADADMVEKAIGPGLFAKYGGKSITMANIDKLLKGSELDDKQKAGLRSLIYTKRGEPRVRLEAKSLMDD